MTWELNPFYNEDMKAAGRLKCEKTMFVCYPLLYLSVLAHYHMFLFLAVKLKYLDISYCPLTRQGIMMLLQLLTDTFSVLETLHLAFLQGLQDTSTFVISFELLKQCNWYVIKYTMIMLFSYILRNKNVKVNFIFFFFFTSLKLLDISGNTLSSREIESLDQFITNHQNLTVIK